MRILRNVLSVSVMTFIAVGGAHAASRTGEDYIRAPMPPGVQVVPTELEGPVFADAQGHTLYKWPKRGLRNGDAGDVQGKTLCEDKIQQVNSGLMSPYPGGLELPELETRKSCTAMWPPLYAAADSKPVGEWTIIDRPDGRKQWAYEAWPIYSSILDKKPGDTLGGTTMSSISEVGAVREPIGPDANVPSQFRVSTNMRGRQVELRDGWSVYTYDGDNRNKSNCAGACLDGWQPVLAPDYARPLGEWTTFERSPGVRQWAFRAMPIYRYVNDRKVGGLDGSDIPRWHNVYTQMAPDLPQGFTMKKTLVGLVIGDSQQRTIYKYNCNDDALDQLSCDYPEAPQAYRYAVCGGGDPELCVKVFPYVIAPVGAKTGNTVWGTMYIDPKTGKRATAKTPGALNVWTFRERPVYTFAGNRGYGDTKPTDINGHGWGEFNGSRNGFQAMVYRDIYSNRDGEESNRSAQ